MKLVHALHNICFFHEKNNTILFMFLDSSSELIIFQAARTNGQPLNFFVCVALFSRFSAIIQDESSNLIPVFFKFLFLFHFFLDLYIDDDFSHHFFFLLKNARAVNVFPFPIFSLVFSSIGFPIEKNQEISELGKNCYYFFTTI